VLAACDVRFTRRSGPGGQHRNKVETAVILRHRPTGLTAEAAERRGQAENRAAALFRLRLRLALEVRSDACAALAPSPLWRSRCRDGRIAINPAHDDFPTLLAEALDVLAACAMDAPEAAGRLKCTPTQLARLLKEEPRAHAAVNARRSDLGLRPLL
jgi:hypothetical protein